MVVRAGRSRSVPPRSASALGSEYRLRKCPALLLATVLTAATPSPPPQIYRIVTTPFCAPLMVGYNPLGRLVAGLQWVRSETDKRESSAARSIMAAMATCPK